MTASMLLLLLAAAPWTAKDTQVQAAVVALGVVDIALTQVGLSKMDASERNPLLGKNPSPVKLWSLGLSGLAAHSVVAWMLPRGWREGWQAAGLTVEAVMVVSNGVIVAGGF
jgi:hypothetical protein